MSSLSQLSTKQISRRALCAGALSLVGLALIRPTFAAQHDVEAAILEDFGVADPVDGNVLIDLPDFTDSGKSVPLGVSIPCTMEGLDYPEVVAIYAERNPRPRIAKVFFTPACGQATFSTRVRIDSFQNITVVVKMASGEIFKGVRKVNVTYGACEQAIAYEQFPPGWSPSIKVSTPKLVTAGEQIDIRTIINHPMETGLRHNQNGLLIPVRIIEWFRCYAGDDLIFSAKLEPAIAANPYFTFNMVIKETTELHFEWVDTSSDVYTADAFVVAA
ncbi:MAG: thiosulfate oxidation carrier complex protein SoxZ [Devosia sp.]|nr:thiosulfate oxidation carrier complex protein SoxZ [Devosia sp.]